MDIQNSNTLYIGGYFEQGDPANCRLTYPRRTRAEAARDAEGSGEPRSWRVVLECEVVDCEFLHPDPEGSKSKPEAASGRRPTKS